MLAQTFRDSKIVLLAVSILLQSGVLSFTQTIPPPQEILGFEATAHVVGRVVPHGEDPLVQAILAVPGRGQFGLQPFALFATGFEVLGRLAAEHEESRGAEVRGVVGVG